MPNSIPHGETGHQHCYHAYHGPIWMVIPDGHIVQKCCKCEATRLVHIDHAHGQHRGLPDMGMWPNRGPDLGRWLVNGIERRNIY